MKRQLTRVESYIEKGKAEGAKLVLGGGRPAHLQKGYFVEPTVFADVDTRMTIAQEEIFGPVVPFISYDGVEDALAKANSTMYGLASKAWRTISKPKPCISDSRDREIIVGL